MSEEADDIDEELTEDEPTPPGASPPPAPTLQDDQLMALLAMVKRHDDILNALPEQLKSSFAAVQGQIAQQQTQPSTGSGGNVLFDIIGKLINGPPENPMNDFFLQQGARQYELLSQWLNRKMARELGLPDHVTVD